MDIKCLTISSHLIAEWIGNCGAIGISCETQGFSDVPLGGNSHGFSSDTISPHDASGTVSDSNGNVDHFHNFHIIVNPPHGEIHDEIILH